MTDLSTIMQLPQPGDTEQQRIERLERQVEYLLHVIGPGFSDSPDGPLWHPMVQRFPRPRIEAPNFERDSTDTGPVAS